MTQINCADCLKTYRPYRFLIALLRVLMYGFSDWMEFEDQQDIEEQFRYYCRDRNERIWLIGKIDKYYWDYSFAGDFTFYYQYLENKRRKTISATFLCFDCEKYFCTNCVSIHSGHFTFSKDDKYDISEWGRISVEMLDRFKGEGYQKLEKIGREQTILYDVVDVRCEHDKPDLDVVLRELERKLEDYDNNHNYEFMAQELDYLINPRVEGLHILNDNKELIVTDDENRCIKIFNNNDNKMTRRIKLSSSPWDITEIPSTDPSQSLIAVSFPLEKQIHIMNIQSTPAQVVSSINVHGECFDLAYCNNKLITRCREYQDIERRESIHVMDMSGKIVNTVDLHKLPGIKLKRYYSGCMSVHAESETIYVCHWIDPSCVISLSLDGQVLHSVTFTDLKPMLIHVDKVQNVYVMDHRLPIYKLSSDLGDREKFIDEDVDIIPYIRVMKFHSNTFYLASYKGHIYIIQYNPSRGDDQREHDDENRSVQHVEYDDKNRPVQYKRRAEQLNPTTQPDCKTTKRRR